MNSSTWFVAEISVMLTIYYCAYLAVPTHKLVEHQMNGKADSLDHDSIDSEEGKCLFYPSIVPHSHAHTHTHTFRGQTQV